MTCQLTPPPPDRTSASTPGSAMSYRQLEEFINRSTVELEEQEKLLLNQATQVNAWDGQLIRNGQKVRRGGGGTQRPGVVIMGVRRCVFINSFWLSVAFSVQSTLLR